ncbi:glycosyl transferase [Paenibacillus sp. FSL H7-0357]|uniref:glycosyltransferase family 4 protein n=1 Tax=Paenibacillus sp. FSL H7-0357 TaxID=1536774 RepID=UPI0004F7F77C|nr:glycosyltransferase family 4 protein [Paenibacillus sp. FSL H7-0357]AIQ20133.1 glycosyl transferase [Paenibacillus sp. FSL H7-0357]
MKILFLTLAYPEGEDSRNLYVDLMREFKDRGDEVYVICQREKRYEKETELKNEFGIQVLRVKTGNVTKTGFLEKGISTLLIERQFIKAVKEYFKDIRFDLIIYSTPPITFVKIVDYIKKRDRSKSYLLLKDIFPQNAVDLGIIKERSMLWHYFRRKERSLYAISDNIGCMSKANVDYVIKHNTEVDINQIEVCPNSIKPVQMRTHSSIERNRIRSKYNIPSDAVVYVYGGNLGKPQGIDFLIDVLKCLENIERTYVLIVGSGTEFEKIKNQITISKQKNTRLEKYMPKNEFDEILSVSDVGLVFLDARFTIPNFPSRLNSYMEFRLPILAATDVNTDVKDMLHEAKCGLWSKSGDLEGFKNNVTTLNNSEKLRLEMGSNGRAYLEENFTVDKTYKIIVSH